MQISIQVQFFYSIGVLLIMMGILFAGNFNTIFEMLLKKALVLRPGSESLKIFVQKPLPITVQVYLFNVSNPVEVQFDGAKPILQEIGPYTYTKYEVKENLEFFNTAGTLQYKQKDTYIFDKENSVGSEDDNITTINPLLVVLGNKMSSYNSVFQNLGGWLLTGFEAPNDLFMKKTVGELLFKGYTDPLVEFVNSLSGGTAFNGGRFGYFRELNNTHIGTFKVNTGANDMREHLFLKERNGKTKLDFFDTPTCNMINGTDGAQFPPLMNKKDHIQLYVEYICRSAEFTFLEEYYLHGLKTYKYTLSKSFLSSTNPYNLCFCRDKWFCTDGIMDISSCKGAPVLISSPHLYLANESMANRIEGLSPKKEKHETLAYIEPITGLVVKAESRLQVNFPITKYKSLTAFKYVNDFVLPIFWMYQGASAPPELSNQLKDLITKPFTYAYIVSGLTMLIGTFLILIGYWRGRNVRKDGKMDYHKQMLYPKNCYDNS